MPMRTLIVSSAMSMMHNMTGRVSHRPHEKQQVRTEEGVVEPKPNCNASAHYPTHSTRPILT